VARVDVHQHVWPRALIEQLRWRRDGLRLDGWELRLPGEPPYLVNPADHDIARRADLAAADGIDVAVVSLSSPLGIEHLPADQARPLLDAYHEGALALPPLFRVWAAASLADPAPAALSALLDAGCIGLQLPATALADAAGLELCAELFAVLHERGRPLFVHPGPASGGPGVPSWWPAIVPYATQMHTAWFAWHAYGAPRFPHLKVVFAMLGGLAPLHFERCAARGGPLSHSPAVYLETSSYGRTAIAAVAEQVGRSQLVLGSDRPYAVPAALGPDLDYALRVINPAALLD
jgi:predicted TIM-barrel fold metal-dependent hydrolase